MDSRLVVIDRRSWCLSFTMEALLLSLLFLPGCMSRNAEYLTEGTGHLTQQEVARKWGPPSGREVLASGEMWTYTFQTTDSMEHPVTCDKYELRFDAQQVLTQWTSLAC
ncbi:MAG TPA: hypothetical protein VFS39_15730 [Nitrospira sp.]|nr:hypothetical protein [Nitrospira sp.]